MKLFWLSLLLILIFSISIFSQDNKIKSNVVPKTTTVKFSLLDLPGVKDDASKWEISYELRLITEKERYEAGKKDKLKQMENNEKLGVLVSKGNFAKSVLSESRNREVVFNTSISKEIQERLRNEPKNRVNLGEVKLTDEVIKKSKEDEAKAQVFLLYANAIVYDAKLRKNVIVPLSRILPFARHPKANFEMTLRVTENGNYISDVVLPETPTLNSITKTIKQ